MQCLPPEYHHMHHLYRLVGWHQQKTTRTFCSFWDDTETTMKKPGYNICFVPLYCSLTNYECKHSTDCDTLLMTEIAHWVAEEEVFFLCKFNKNDACFNMHLQLSLKVFIFPQCGACINAPYKVLLLTCVVNWFKESFLFSPVVSALGSESVEPLFIEVQVFFVFFSSKDLKSLNDKDRVRHLTEISTFFNNFFR